MSIQNVGQLIDALSQYDPDMPVLAVYQPSWPIRQPVMQVWQSPCDGPQCPNCDRALSNLSADSGGFCRACNMQWDPDDFDPLADADNAVYLVVDGSMGDDNPYGPKDAFQR